MAGASLIDGTGVPMTAKETAGRDGKGEGGRARTREVKFAVFFTQDKLDDDGYPVRDRDSSSYIATFEPASVFVGLVKAEGIRRGADHVRQFTIIGDGARGSHQQHTPHSDANRLTSPRPKMIFSIAE